MLPVTSTNFGWIPPLMLSSWGKRRPTKGNPCSRANPDSPSKTGRESPFPVTRIRLYFPSFLHVPLPPPMNKGTITWRILWNSFIMLHKRKRLSTFLLLTDTIYLYHHFLWIECIFLPFVLSFFVIRWIFTISESLIFSFVWKRIYKLICIPV